MKFKKIIRIISLAVIIAGSPFLLADWNGNILPFNNVNADIGTCCPGGGICVIGQVAIPSAYAIEAGSDCPSSPSEGDIILVQD